MRLQVGNSRNSSPSVGAATPGRPITEQAEVGGMARSHGRNRETRDDAAISPNTDGSEGFGKKSSDAASTSTSNSTQALLKRPLSAHLANANARAAHSGNDSRGDVDTVSVDVGPACGFNLTSGIIGVVGGSKRGASTPAATGSSISGANAGGISGANAGAGSSVCKCPLVSKLTNTSTLQCSCQCGRCAVVCHQATRVNSKEAGRNGGSQNDDEGLLDWFGNSVKSAYDAMFLPDADELHQQKTQQQQQQQPCPLKANGESPSKASVVKQRKGLRRERTPSPTKYAAGVATGSAGDSSKGANATSVKTKLSISFGGAKNDNAAEDERERAPTGAKMLSASQSSTSTILHSTSGARNRKYLRAQTAPPRTLERVVEKDSGDKNAATTATVTATAATSASLACASIDSSDSFSERKIRIKQRMRSATTIRDGNTDRSPIDASATTASRRMSATELEDNQGRTLLPPLPPKPIRSTKQNDTHWADIHDRLIDELFEESRRDFLAKQENSGDASSSTKSKNTHQEQRGTNYDANDNGHGWKLGHFLGGGGGHSNADEVSTAASKGKSWPFSNSKEEKAPKKRLYHRLRPRKPKFLRKKEKENETDQKGLRFVAAAIAAVVGVSGNNEENPENPHQNKKGPVLEPVASKPLLNRLGRMSPSRRKLGENNSYSSGRPSSKSDLVRATGTYKGRPDPNPATFLSPNCKLQKDRGAGKEPGTSVVAKSRSAALEKLRQKVDVIIEVEQSSASVATSRAKLKLKPAVVVHHTAGSGSHGIIETRSLVSVKMGFFSMKYGILLRWDTNSDLVTLIVLRKMVSPDFLDVGTSISGAAFAHPTQSSGQALSSLGARKKSPSKRLMKDSPSKLILGRLVDGANAILHGSRWDSESNAGGTEVAHLGPPFLISRPEEFQDASLLVTVVKATSLCAESRIPLNPYIRLSIGTEAHRTKAIKMTTDPVFLPGTNNTCRLTVSGNPRDDDLHLKVEVYDWRPFGRDRILGVVFLPVASVEPQKDITPEGGQREAKVTEVTIPVRMMRNADGAYGYVSLELIHRNDHLCWLKEELRARGKSGS